MQILKTYNLSMPIFGNLVSRALRIRKQFNFPLGTPRAHQHVVLHRLLTKARNTEFGRQYGFSGILESPQWLAKYRESVPVRNYNRMHDEWWYKCLSGQANVTWPGKVRYFALSSGTSESASKHIPVTKDMLRNNKKVGIKQLYSMVNFKVPPRSFEKGILMLAGTTSLYPKGDYYEGDMSGISAKNIPRWFRYFYKPGGNISKKPNWEQRIRLIVRKAPQWDVATICGVPAWVQIVMEEIIRYHGVKNIHEVWPNLAVYIHGGVSFEPYRESFSKLMKKPIAYIETYMASEGSFGFQARPGTKGIKLVLNAGIFYEFIPFNEENFDGDGEVKPNPKAYMVHEVVEGVEYAVVLTTCAGAWRYLLGDVVKFTSVKEHEIMIVGRTKQFMSLCGEHLSIDNMNKAMDVVAKKLNITIGEFTLTGLHYKNLFAHRWYIGTDDPDMDTAKARELIDQTLCDINDDYAVERTAALKEVFVEILPNNVFIDYLKEKGKAGAMNKFPRVMKNGMQSDWENFLQTRERRSFVGATS